MHTDLKNSEQANQRKASIFFKNTIQKKYFANLQQKTLDKIRSNYLRACAFEQRKTKIKVLNGFMLDSIRFQQLNNQAVVKYCKNIYLKYFYLLKWCQSNKLGKTINSFSKNSPSSNDKKLNNNSRQKDSDDKELLKQFYEESKQQINRVLFNPKDKKNEIQQSQKQQFDWQRHNRQQAQRNRIVRPAFHPQFQNPKSCLTSQKEAYHLSYTRQRFASGNQPFALSSSRRSAMTAIYSGASVNMPRRKYAPITQIPSLPEEIHIHQIDRQLTKLQPKQKQPIRQNNTKDFLRTKNEDSEKKEIQKLANRRKNIIEAVIIFKNYEMKILGLQIFAKDEQVAQYCKQNKEYVQKLKSY